MKQYLMSILFVAFLLPVYAAAQSAQITGRITDPAGAVVVSAKLTLVNSDNGTQRETTSNDEGYYTIPLLQPGNYQLTVQKDGFKPTSQSGIALQVDQAARLDFSLQLGATTDEVKITADAPLLERETSSLGQVIEGRAVTDLPLNGRNYLQLAKLTAGVLDPPAGDRAAAGGSFVANGVRTTLNNFILDGVDNNSRIVDLQSSSNIVVQPSIDALAEFKVQTHNFSAEYGHSAGAVVNAVIKSGTNAFHGTAFEFHRNSVFDAKNFFLRPQDKKPQLIRNQFGGVLGGPIIRNKTFFFGSFEGTRERRGITLVTTVPTQDLRNGNFGVRGVFDPATTQPSGGGFIRTQFANNQIPRARFDPVAVRLLDLIPLPNAPGAANNYIVARKQQDTRDQYDFRVDHNFSDASKLFGRFSLTERTFVNPGPFDPPLIGSSFFQQAPKDQSARGAAIGHTQVFSASGINEFRTGYNRIRDFLVPFVSERLFEQFGFRGIPNEAGVTGLPNIVIAGFANLGEATFLPNAKISETFQVNDNFSFFRGPHAIKVGGNYRFVRSFFNVSGNARGNYSFNGTFSQDPQNRTTTGNAWADFLLGVTNNANLGTPFLGDIRNHYWGFFVQDDWKVTPKLTLNLGLRYELFSPQYERHNRQGNFLLDQRKLIFPEDKAPAGLPASLITTIPDGVHQRALVQTDRNNFGPRLGMAYQLAQATVVRAGFGLFYADHAAVGASDRLVGNPPFRRDKAFPTDQIAPIITFASGFPVGTLDTVQFDPATTTFRSWALGYPQAYTYHWNLDVQHEFSALLVELGYTGTRGAQLPINFDTNAPRPGAGAVNARRPLPGFGTVTRNQPLSNSHYHAFQAKAERRFAQGFGLLASYTWSKSIDTGGEQLIGGDQLYRDTFNLALERSVSLFDMRHRFVTSYLWELPFGKGKRFVFDSAVAEALFGNWQINGITTLRGGTPFTPELGFSFANTGHARPNRYGDGNLERDARTLQQFFDKSAFLNTATDQLWQREFRFGTAGKNILRGPGAVNFDFSLFKSFPLRFLGDRGEMQFRAEAFNFLNTPQFDNPNPRVDIPVGGSITALRNNMREWQFGLKLLF